MALVLPRRIFSCFQARYGNTRPQRCPICAGSHLTDTYEKFPFFLASNLKWFFLSSPHPAALCAFSEGRCSLGGSQPCFSPNQIVGQSDHMGRAHRSHRWGHRFESCCDHHGFPLNSEVRGDFFIFIFLRLRSPYPQHQNTAICGLCSYQQLPE